MNEVDSVSPLMKFQIGDHREFRTRETKRNRGHECWTGHIPRTVTHASPEMPNSFLTNCEALQGTMSSWDKCSGCSAQSAQQRTTVVIIWMQSCSFDWKPNICCWSRFITTRPNFTSGEDHNTQHICFSGTHTCTSVCEKQTIYITGKNPTANTLIQLPDGTYNPWMVFFHPEVWTNCVYKVLSET